MTEKEMLKSNALIILRDYEKVHSVAIGMKGAIEVAMSAERNAVAIKAENDVALKVLMADKEKVKKVKAEIVKVEGGLQGKLDETNKIHKALKIKLATERDIITKDNEGIKSALANERTEDRKKHNVTKFNYAADIKRWEKKVLEMKAVYEETKDLTLKEIKKR